jgi:hypothetical protein
VIAVYVAGSAPRSWLLDPVVWVAGVGVTLLLAVVGGMRAARRSETTDPRHTNSRREL